MHAHRCKECTLYRCDVADSACSECVSGAHNVQNAALEAITKAYAAGINVFYSLGGLSGGTNQQAAPAGAISAGPVILTLIPGDNKHNARLASRALMEVDWAVFRGYLKSVGAADRMSLQDLHTFLKAFARS